MKKVPNHLKSLIYSFKPYYDFLRNAVVRAGKTPYNDLAPLVVQYYALYEDNPEEPELLEKSKEFTYKMSAYIKALTNNSDVDNFDPAILGLVLDFLGGGNPQQTPQQTPQQAPAPSKGLDVTTVALIVGALIVVALIIVKV